MIDTPAINFTDDPQFAKKEIALWKEKTSPKPHAILLAISCEEMHTRENYDMYKEIRRTWGDDSAFDDLVVAFTFGDRLDHDIDVKLKGVSKELKNVLEDASNRFIVFNAEAGEDDKKKQTRKLLDVIEQQGNLIFHLNGTY